MKGHVSSERCRHLGRRIVVDAQRHLGDLRDQSDRIQGDGIDDEISLYGSADADIVRCRHFAPGKRRG